MISVFNFDVSILSLPVKMYPSLNLYVTNRASLAKQDEEELAKTQKKPVYVKRFSVARLCLRVTLYKILNQVVYMLLLVHGHPGFIRIITSTVCMRRCLP